MVDVGSDAQTLYEHVPCGLLTYAPEGTVLWANRTLLDWLGRAREDVVGRTAFVDLLTPGSRIYHETHYAPLLRMQGSIDEIAFTMVAADGARVPVLVSSRLLPGEQEPPVMLSSVFRATDRRRYEQELLLARRTAEESRARLALLHAVTDELAAAGDLDQVSEVLTRAGTEALAAARCALWLRDDATHVLAPRAGSGLGADPIPLPALPLDAAAARDPRLTAGETVVLPVEQARQCFPLVAGALAGEGPGVLALAPILQDRSLLGVLGCRFDEPDALPAARLEILATLVAQGGLAVPRARLFEEQRDVAQALQRSLLPAELPQDARFDVSTAYRPARDGPAVGGDWYDAFWVGSDRLAVVVGDVVGRGVHAAAAMGQLRSAVRALASASPEPAQVLEALDHFVDGVPAASSATMVYAVLDVATGVLRYACAGHPPPVLVDPSGRAALLWDGRSVPLGVLLGSGHREAAEVVLSPGARLLLYTDGLVERRDAPLDARIDELAATVAAHCALPPRRLVSEVSDAMVGAAEVLDDVCLLCLTRT